MLDCLIVGGGPAGLTAAVYLGRYRRLARLVDDGASRAALIPASHNYPGFKGIGGPDLLARLRDQALLYGTVLETGRITSLIRSPDGSFAARSGNREILARSVLLATGLVDENPAVGGLRAGMYTGAIRYCPICDGFEAMDRRIGVIGNGEEACKKALFLRTYSQEVVLLETGQEPKIAGKMREALTEAGVKMGRQAVRIECLDDMVTVIVEDGTRVNLDVLYPALGCEVRSELATALGAKCTEKGNLEVNHHQETSVDWLYAAGDVVSDLHQLSVATGHAAIAATDIHNRLANLR